VLEVSLVLGSWDLELFRGAWSLGFGAFIEVGSLNAFELIALIMRCNHPRGFCPISGQAVSKANNTQNLV
jgi:hypothetical protein